MTLQTDPDTQVVAPENPCDDTVHENVPVFVEKEMTHYAAT